MRNGESASAESRCIMYVHMYGVTNLVYVARLVTRSQRRLCDS